MHPASKHAPRSNIAPAPHRPPAGAGAAAGAGTVEHLEIGPEHGGQRIDNFLLRHFKGVPRSRIYRLLRKGEVRVNRGRVRPDYRLVCGDTLRLPPVRRRDPEDRRPFAHGAGGFDWLDDAILYEDAQWLALNKPAGLAVHGGSGLRFGAIEALRAARPQAPFLELVHRLDRDTSGCLLIAKRRSALRAAHEALRQRGAEKSYLALVRGSWGRSARVNLPLTRYTVRSAERFVKPDRAGKEAISDFELLERSATASLVRVRLVTGRTHQIRVHAAARGHPIGGDQKYGDAAFDRVLAGHGLHRLFLHADRLQLPAQGLEVAAPLPAELRAVLDRLGLGLPRCTPSRPRRP